MPMIQHHTLPASPPTSSPNPYHRQFIGANNSSALPARSLATAARHAKASTPIQFDELATDVLNITLGIALFIAMFVFVAGLVAVVYMGWEMVVMSWSKRRSKGQKRECRGRRREREGDAAVLGRPLSRGEESDGSSLWSSDAEWRSLQNSEEERRLDYGTTREEPRREAGIVEGISGSEMGEEMSEVGFPGENLGMGERERSGYGRRWREGDDEEDGSRWVERALNDERRAGELMRGEGLPSDIV